MKYSEDGKIGFIEESHQYIHIETGEILTSVTTVIGKYKQPFDSDYWSKKKADERGVNQQVILDEWETKKNRACDMGTYIHNGLEDAFNGNLHELDSKLYAKSSIANQFTREVILTKKIEPILIEPILYDVDLGIAGQMDLFGKTSKGNFVFDYKTNEELKMKNFYSNMNRPFEKMDDCNWNHYQIQLNTYRELLEKTGQKVDGMYVIYFDYFEYKFMKVNKFDVLNSIF